MPARSGAACVAELRRAGSRVPAILITGSVDVVPTDQADTQTVVLRKPFALAALVELVGRHGRTWPVEAPNP